MAAVGSKKCGIRSEFEHKRNTKPIPGGSIAMERAYLPLSPGAESVSLALSQFVTFFPLDCSADIPRILESEDRIKKSILQQDLAAFDSH